jgi:GlpG protein
MKNRHIKIVLNAPVVLTFSLICLIVTILGIVSGGSITHSFFSTFRGPFSSPLTYFRAVSHVFGHISWAHFLGNVSYILLLGPMLEEKYGGKKLILVILITAIVTSVFIAWFFPQSAVMGASGVVFAFILLTSFTEFRSGEIPITFILVAVIYLGQEIVNGLFVQDNISQLGHILGGLTGAIIGYSLNRKGR